MPGERDLSQLLQAMQPHLHLGRFTFRTVAAPDLASLPASLLATAIGLFREDEGVTIIAPADTDVTDDRVWACITLTIHSDLYAVGFLAAITAKLAAKGISVNAVSAFYHDHLFVPWNDRDAAMQALSTFS